MQLSSQEKQKDFRLMVGDLSTTGGGLAETPGGLLVPAKSIDSLIKAEAKRLLQEDKNSASPMLFSPYRTYDNMGVYGAREKPRGTMSFDDLYMAADRSFIDRQIIRARIDESKMVWQKAVDGKQVGFKVVHKMHDDPNWKPTKEVLARCAEMEEMLDDPTPVAYASLFPNGVRVHDGLKDCISRLVRAELIIDRKVLYRYKRRDGKGYAAFHWLPGATIKPVHEALKEWAAKNSPNKLITQQGVDNLSRKIGKDLWTSDYCQIFDGAIITAFTADEISIKIANPSDQIDRNGFGTSRLEESIDLTATFLFAWRYNQELFKTNYPEAILTVSGEYDKAGLEAFKQQMMGESGGVGNNWRLPIIAGTPGKDVAAFKVEAQKLRDTPKDMLFDQFIRMLINLKAAAYGAHPSILNFGMEGGGGSGGSPLFGGSKEQEIKSADDHWFNPHLLDMCEWFTDALITPRYDDLKLIIVGLDEAEEKARLDIRLEKGKVYMTKNELRMADGLEPMGDVKDEKNPWNFPADAPIPSYMSSFSQEKQMDAMNAQQEQGAGGHNAGVELEGVATADADEDLFDRTIAVNLRGVFLCMKHQIRQLLAQGGGGAIVNTASVAGLVGAATMPAYTASKHGVVGLTKAAALEYAKRNIRVNAVCPGVVRTAMTERAVAQRPERAAFIDNLHPMGRIAEPAEIAATALWLCSPAASFVTGQALAVDGGMVAR